MVNNRKPVYVGLGVIIKKDNKVLFGLRKGSHGQDTWSPPGGYLDFGETFEQCARREVKEETSLNISNLHFIMITNDFFKSEDKHFVTVWIESNYQSGEVKIMEPDKCQKWQWFDWDKLPENLFLPTINLRKQGYSPF